METILMLKKSRDNHTLDINSCEKNGLFYAILGSCSILLVEVSLIEQRSSVQLPSLKVVGHFTTPYQQSVQSRRDIGLKSQSLDHGVRFNRTCC